MSIHNLSHNLGIDHKTTEHYLTILASVGLARPLYPYEAGSHSLRKSSKLFLNNTTLMHTLQQYHGHEVPKGTERELFFIQALQDAQVEIFIPIMGIFAHATRSLKWAVKIKLPSNSKKPKMPF